MGSTPSKQLLAAAQAGDEGAMDAALRKGASINCQDELRRTPLHAAARYGRLAALQKLLRLRAQDLRDATGCTAMHYACEQGHNEVLKALIMHGSDVWALNIKMQRPVHLAYASRKTPTVRLFEEMCCPFRGEVEVHRSQLFGMMASFQKRWAVVHRARRFDNPAVDRRAFVMNFFTSREAAAPELELRNPEISDPSEVQRQANGTEIITFTLKQPRGQTVRCRCPRPVYNWLHMVTHASFGSGATPAVDQATGLVQEPAWQVGQNLYMPRTTVAAAAPAPAPAAPVPAPATAGGGGGGSGYPVMPAGGGTLRVAPGASTGSGAGGGYVGQFPGAAGGGGAVPPPAATAPPAKTSEQEAGERLAARFDELGLDDDGAPDEFLCPISYEVMNDPVIAADGHTYDRAGVQSWFAKGNMRSPKTNAELSTTTVFPNHSLRSRIIEWREKMIAEAQAGGGGSGSGGGAVPPVAATRAGAGGDPGGAVAPPPQTSGPADPYAGFAGSDDKTPTPVGGLADGLPPAYGDGGGGDGAPPPYGGGGAVPPPYY